MRVSPVSLSAVLVIVLQGCAPGAPPRRTGGPASYFAPADPPPSRYVIDARIGPGGSTIDGRETVSLRNTGRDPIGIVAFDWNTGAFSTLEVSVGGRRIYPPDSAPAVPDPRPIMMSLPEPLSPGDGLALSVAFSQRSGQPQSGTSFSSTRWFPRLWWDDLERHDSFSVKLETSPGVAVAASGLLDPRSGRYEAAAARTFGVYLAEGLKTAWREVDGVRIASYFTDKGAKAAAVCLDTAADAVHFYKQWLGFYPFPFLSIVPGGAGRWGGYPVATGIVAIHGLETYVDGESPRHWQHITSHEIGHEYWSEWVLDPDQPAWLWIAMGIFADTEFMTVRGFDPGRRAGWVGNYINAIPLYYDTTLDAPPDREDAVKFDFNNTVVHSKGPAAIFALDAVLGRETFLRVYKRCLRDYGGKPLGWRAFRSVAEAESARNLGWFFDAWVRSNQYLCYALDSRESRPLDGGGFITEIGVRRLGTMSMPMPVRAVFEDGSSQTAWTDRTKAASRVVFKSASRLRDALLDPEKRLAGVEAPIPKISDAAQAKLAFGWEAKGAPDVYAAVKGEPIVSGDLWWRLGLQLYGADRLDEAADCFGRLGALETDALHKFGAQAWLGLLDDLRGRRGAALAHYRAASGIVPDKPLRFDQYKIAMDRAWIEERMKSPFKRESAVRLPERPSAAEIAAVVDGLNWSREGETPLLVYRKTAGLTIADSGVWFKLGLLLFDSGYYQEALDAFVKTAALESSGVTAFAARAWQGHMYDLLGNRPAALAAYREALKIDPGTAMKHSQWGMTIDRAWIEERLAAPFVWRR